MSAPATRTARPSEPIDRFRGQLHSRLSRLLTGALHAVAWLAVPAIAYLGLFADTDLLLPGILVGTVLVFAALPFAAARVIERTAGADVAIEPDRVVVERRDLRLEIPRAAIARATPWSVPLPGPGLDLALRPDGRVIPLALADPAHLLRALGEDAAARRPVAEWAAARARRAPRRWYHRAAAFVAFPLPFAAILFRAHQWIAYGGTFGQWYLEGRAAWLRTFGVYWLVVAIYLVLWAALWRGAAEAVALAAAGVAPSQAAKVRRAVELACDVAYYAGVPALVAARFLA